MPFSLSHFLGALAADPPGQLDVLWHDGHALGVDGAQVGVLEQADQVGLGSLLKTREEKRFSFASLNKIQAETFKFIMKATNALGKN